MTGKESMLNVHVLHTVRVSPDHTIIAAYDPASTTTNPGNGGTRWMEYASTKAAEQEARTLAQRMTVKHNIYRTGFRGAKIVISGPRSPETETQVLDAVAELLNKFGGTLYTGCDPNTTNEDMKYLSEKSPFILNSLSNEGIDTSKATGSGVFGAARSTIDNPFRKEVPHVAVHGLGKVGWPGCTRCPAVRLPGECS